MYEFDAEACPPFLAVKSNLRYFSLPTGLELAPFLQTLRILSAGGSRLSLRTLKRLETFLIPTRLEAFIAPACPHCPALVVLCSDLALASSYLEVSIVDVTLFPAQARERGIRAVPTLVINGQERLVGALGEEVLVDRFVNRELAAFHSETFRRILKEGDARKLAATMLAEGEIPGSALKLLSNHDWTLRLGMMVVLEEIGTHRPELAPRACPDLVTLLSHQDPSRRADAALFLGLIGDAPRCWKGLNHWRKMEAQRLPRQPGRRSSLSGVNPDLLLGTRRGLRAPLVRERESDGEPATLPGS